MQKKLIQVDFNPWYFICNMQCQYCIPHYQYRVEGNRIYIRLPGEKERFYARIDHLFIRAFQVLKKLSEEYEVGILTFSGTEAFLFDSIFTLLQQIKKMFSKIQIITNGLNLSETYIKRLKELNDLNNISITLSLDGYNEETNFSRTGHDKEKLSKILHSLDLLIKYEISFDVYTVITKYNIRKLEDFFRYIEEKKTGCGIQVWPVFGNNNLEPCKEDIVYLELLLQKYDTFQLALQPKVYYQYMIQYLKTKKRMLPCYLPYCSFYLRDNGNIKACLCNGIEDVGNIFEQRHEILYDKPFYQEILSVERQKMPCNKCFINWDIFNLYFENLLDTNEIQNIPLFQQPHFINIIKKVKQQVVEMKKGREHGTLYAK